MDRFIILIAMTLIFFSWVYLSVWINEPTHTPTIQQYCSQTDISDYDKQECRIYEETYRQCIREDVGTEWYDMCYADLALTEHNLNNIIFN
jgi:hypothetical protein